MAAATIGNAVREERRTPARYPVADVLQQTA
jgi:hypothetical protein